MLRLLVLAFFWCAFFYSTSLLGFIFRSLFVGFIPSTQVDLVGPVVVGVVCISLAIVAWIYLVVGHFVVIDLVFIWCLHSFFQLSVVAL